MNESRATAANGATLNRTAFVTDRAMEYFTEKQLTQQIGCRSEHWPLALLKELIDNALDAGELAGVAPHISVTVETDALSVEDNGPGLPVTVIEGSLNYAARISDKANYVSPTRGQLGNALKCVWAAPFVIDGENGSVEIHSQGERHLIEVSLDRIAQRPLIKRTSEPLPIVKKGTFVKMRYPSIASYLTGAPKPFLYKKTARQLVEEYAAFNPHATFTITEPNESAHMKATSADWRKWKADVPTSPHWYSVERLRTLIAAYVTHDRLTSHNRTVRELVSEFAGLTGSAKQKAVTQKAGLSGSLADLVEGDDIAAAKVERLLVAMQEESRPIKPSALGVLGESHLREHMTTQRHVARDSIRYKKIDGIESGLPFVIEAAFGVFDKEFQECRRDLCVGLNFSPALLNPMRQLQEIAGEFRIDYDDPICVIVHLACPRIDFEDTGKGTLQLGTVQLEALRKCVQGIAKEWKASKRQADANDKVSERELQRMRKAQSLQRLDLKEAAFYVMEEAYNETSDNGRLPATARQIMYKARPQVLALTGGKIWKNSAYFTQTLLPNFVEAYPEITATWDVVYDARGHFLEPHTNRRIDLGTLAVRGYVNDWSRGVTDSLDVKIETDYPTVGHANRYRFALFIEKEGFNPLIERADIANRFDIAIMSTKGMSVTASRTLVEKLSSDGVTILVARDFDKAGFSIVHTLSNDTRRFQYDTVPRIIDLGLRLEDVEEMQLESEEVEYTAGKRGDLNKDPRENMRESGATERECAFLVEHRKYDRSGWVGKRVELNAMTSPQFIQWIERKLEENGVQKVVPDAKMLETAYRRAWRRTRLQSIIDEAQQEINDETEAIELPSNLEKLVTKAIQGKSEAWDSALSQLASEALAARL